MVSSGYCMFNGPFQKKETNITNNNYISIQVYEKRRDRYRLLLVRIVYMVRIHMELLHKQNAGETHSPRPSVNPERWKLFFEAFGDVSPLGERADTQASACVVIPKEIDEKLWKVSRRHHHESP